MQTLYVDCHYQHVDMMAMSQASFKTYYETTNETLKKILDLIWLMRACPRQNVWISHKNQGHKKPTFRYLRASLMKNLYMSAYKFSHQSFVALLPLLLHKLEKPLSLLNNFSLLQ